MLYPTLDQLIKIVGNRYLLVNIVTKRAKEITNQSLQAGIKLSDKPIKIAVKELMETAHARQRILKNQSKLT